MSKIKKTPKFMIIAALFSVTACTTVGPDFSEPELAEVGELVAEGDVGFADETDRSWWTVFNDPELDALVDRALSGNLDIQLALARVSEARAEMGAVRGALLPQIGIGGQVARDRTSANAPGSFGESSTSNLYQASFDASWEIDLFGGNQRALEAANANLEARSGDVAATEVLVAAEIVRTYIELRTLQQRLHIARAALDNSLEVSELTRRRVAAGSGLQAEISRAESDVSLRRSQLPALEGEIERTADRLAVIAGEAPGAFRYLISEIGPLPRPTIQIEIAYPAAALRARPDVWAAERDLAAATAEIGVATAELYPKLVLPGSGGVLSTSSDSIFSSENTTWSFAPSLSLNLFSGGRVRATIDVAGARQKQARIQFDQLVLNALLEINEGLSIRRASLAQSIELERSRQAARQSADDLRKRYDLGAESIFNVLDAEAAVFDASDNAILAEAGASLALVSLFKATAGAPVDVATYQLNNIPIEQNDF